MYESVGDLSDDYNVEKKLKIGGRGLRLLVAFCVIAFSDKNEICLWILENGIFGSLCLQSLEIMGKWEITGKIRGVKILDWELV